MNRTRYSLPKLVRGSAAGLCMLAAVWLCPALAQQTQEPAEEQLAPLLPAVTTETLAQVLAFAARDRACLKKVAGEYELVQSYKACVDGLRATTYCDADATDIADLAALIDGEASLIIGVIGGPCWSRTSDQWIKSPVLYQLS